MARPRKTLLVRVAPEPKRPPSAEEKILAQNLVAAYVAMRHGIGMDWAKKQYVHEPVAEFWISVARMLIEHIEHLEQQPPKPPRRSLKTQ